MAGGGKPVCKAYTLLCLVCIELGYFNVSLVFLRYQRS